MFSDLEFSPACEECGEEGLPLYRTNGRRVCEECQVEILTDTWADELADEIDLQWLLSDED